MQKAKPYGEWLDSNLVKLNDLKIPNIRVEEYTDEERAKLQKAFGYTFEDFKNTIYPMAEKRCRSDQCNGNGYSACCTFKQ